MRSLSAPELIIILVVVLLLFGAPKLPGLAKSLGESMRIFKKEIKTTKDEASADKKSDAEGTKSTEK